MPDSLTISNHEIKLVTDEGQTLLRPETDLVDMFARYFNAPLNGFAFPDGIKYIEWREPRLVVVHQTSPRIHTARWIAEDSPAEFGPGTKYRNVAISLPYCIIIAVFHLVRNRLVLSTSNELYFSNAPLKKWEDRVYFPALLNVSNIPCGDRDKPWICVQHLKIDSDSDWVCQLRDLIDHTFHSGYNRSSEHNEGASYYGVSEGVPRIHPISEWVKATEEDERFGCKAQWLPAPLSIGEIIEAVLADETQHKNLLRLASSPAATSMSIVTRFMNFVQTKLNSQKRSRRSR